nr:50S ribosomal protein L4 [Ishige okamurae]
MSSEKTLIFSVKDLSGEESKDTIAITLKSKKKNEATDNYLIHRAFLTQRHNERQGTANTLTRSEVRGGGRKPWRQKGTGRARAGSNTSPLWKGGGVSFGPKPKIFSNKINRKERKLALRSLLFAKRENIIVANNLNYTTCKTSLLKKNLNTLGIDLRENVLIVVPKIERNLFKSTQNIRTIRVTMANNLNIRQILIAKYIFIAKESLQIIEDTYNGQ